MKYWECSRCKRKHNTGDQIKTCYCPECLNKMEEVDHGERRTN